MINVLTDVEAGERMLDDPTATGDAVAALEEKLARSGHREQARRLRKKRLELDDTRAREILSGETTTVKEQLTIARRLSDDKCIGLARRVLMPAVKEVKPGDESYYKVHQKATVATYKDPDLPLAWRLDRALEILERAEDLSTSPRPESLGIAGAIYKRKWQVDAERQNLDRALSLYLRGYEQGLPPGAHSVLHYLRQKPDAVLDARKDQGYTGVNAAFILDVMAGLEAESATRAGITSRAAEERRESAKLIREELVRSVPKVAEMPNFEFLKEQWWFYATVGEAFFGLGPYDAANYEKAVEWLVDLPGKAGLERRAAGEPIGALDVPEWEFESTARQLADLALLQLGAGIDEAAFEASPAGQALGRILQNDQQAVRSAFRGRIGLALSGGGFRAALFHIGVLACLAERGVLGHVEVLSCVSGGSIIGAHYYLELRHRLQTRIDADIDAEDYVEIVRRIAEQFLRGVQRNIRTRVLAEWTTNLKMLFFSGYSRTIRVGELYERELFRLVPDGGFTGSPWIPDWIAVRRGYERRRWLDKIQVHPLRADNGHDISFQPRNHNWRRKNKVPALILNATSLNTGHCWQFTSSFMGEPPTPINAKIDTNDRLRRMYYRDAPTAYRDAPTAHRRVRLGHAVAASSGVPGLFEPLSFEDLYPDRTVKLVDGGVCDNQGVWSLLEQDCTVALVSDASGQMESLAAPSAGLLGVPLRANDILQARVREAQYAEVAERQRSRLLRGLMFIHLKRDLPSEQVAWTECPSYRKQSDFEVKRDRGHDVTGFGIDTAAQRKLAAIRTDLDSFNDIEAYALMASGYRMTAADLDGPSPCIPGFNTIVAKGEWAFITPGLTAVLKPDSIAGGIVDQRRHVHRVLDAGANIAFKIWRLSIPLQVATWIVAAAAVAGSVGAVGWLIYSRWSDSVAGAIAKSSLAGRLPNPTFGSVGRWLLWTIGLFVAGLVLGRLFGPRYADRIMKTVQWRDTLRNTAIGIVMATVGFLIARLHLHVFDRWFLYYGRVGSISFPRRQS